jgi:hypothetical protein
MPNSMEKITASKTLTGEVRFFQPNFSQISEELKFKFAVVLKAIRSNFHSDESQRGLVP